jgi:hypothetical protein
MASSGVIESVREVEKEIGKLAPINRSMSALVQVLPGGRAADPDPNALKACIRST